jgi:phenylacetate-CoA ligase
MEFALKWRQREWANIGLNDNIATYRRFRALRGVDYGTCKPMWKFNPLSKELEFNVFGLNTETLKKQVAKLQSFHPRLIEGCPSTISLVAKFIKDWRIPFSVNAVQTSSESLATRREMIEEGFHCKVYDRYGHSEYAVSASECPDGCYHVTEGGIMEFIKDGEAISNGELGEIVGTGLYNYSMPLIRYRTVDMARPSDERCTCGRGLSTIHSIEGRVSDSILTFDERIITGPSFEGYWKNVISPLTPHLAYVHIVQYSKTEITVRIVKMPGYLEKEGVAIVRGLGNLLGSEVEVTFEELSAVPIQKKWRFSESKIDQCLL